MNAYTGLRNRRNAQRGWSLLEAVVVVALMGTMAAGLWKTMELVEQGRRTEVSRDVVQQAEDALHGMLLRDYRLPVPADASLSTSVSGHLEGWLPPGILGIEVPHSIRYTVDSALTTAPTLPYNPDPLKLLPDGELPPSAGLNGLDFCLQVIQREQEGAGGLRFAFGVQHIDAPDRPDPVARAFRVGTLSVSSGQPGRAYTRAVGLTEVVHRLGCIKAFARLAHEVRSAALAHDLADMAGVNAKFRHLGVLATEEAIVNATWRIVNSTVRMAVTVWSTVVNLVTMTTTPFGLAMATPNVIAQALELTSWGMLLEYSYDRLEANEDGLPLARAAYDEALQFEKSLERQYEQHLGRIGSLQQKGLTP